MRLKTLIVFFIERPCDKRPCVNAKQCINKGDGYECVCLPGWTGANCDKGMNRVTLGYK